MKTTSTWSDTEWDTFTELVKTKLAEGIITVTFNKKDGSERIMQCTLSPTIVPQTPLIEGRKERAIPRNSISVYDTTARDWRSFIIKNVTQVDFPEA
jgi:hypothetical protein